MTHEQSVFEKPSADSQERPTLAICPSQASMAERAEDERVRLAAAITLASAQLRVLSRRVHGNARPLAD